MVDTELAGCLDDRKGDVPDIKDVVPAQLLHHIVDRKPKLFQLLLVDLAVADNHPRGARYDPAGGFGFEGERRHDHIEDHEGENRDHAAHQRDIGILDRHGCDIGNHDGHDQFRRLELSELTFPHQAQAGDDDDIDDQHPEKYDEHGNG